MVYYLITKNSEDDWELWVTNDMNDDTAGWSTRGTFQDIDQELSELLDEYRQLNKLSNRRKIS